MFFTNHETRITKHGFLGFHETRITAFTLFTWLEWCREVLKPFSLVFSAPVC